MNLNFMHDSLPAMEYFKCFFCVFCAQQIPRKLVPYSNRALFSVSIVDYPAVTPELQRSQDNNKLQTCFRDGLRNSAAATASHLRDGETAPISAGD